MNSGSDVLMDFTLEGFKLNCSAYTNEDMAIMGKFNYFRFDSGKINTPGKVLVNPRDIYKISTAFDSGKNYMNGNVWGSGPDHVRAKTIGFGLYYKAFVVALS